MSFKKLKIQAIAVPLVLAIFFVFVCNIVLLEKIWDGLQKVRPINVGFVLSIPVFLVLVFNILFVFLSGRRIIKPLFIALILLSSVLTYAMHTYGIIFDRNMIVNVMETNPAEAFSYWNMSLLAWFVGLGVVPASLVYALNIDYPSARRLWLQRLASVMISICMIALIAVFQFKDYAPFIRNNSGLYKEIVPAYALNRVFNYTKKRFFKDNIPHRYVGLDAKQHDSDQGEKKSLVVLIVGETQRAVNYELNGYPRATNAYTRTQGIVSFPHVTSCGTATAVSVPCMFSNLTREKYNEKMADSQDNILDIAKRAGVSVLWLDNDAGCKDVCKNVEYVDVRALHKSDTQQCVGDGCYDSIILEEFAKRFEHLPDATSLIVLHIMGGHGPTYFNRYPADHRVFTPDCPRSDIQNCTHEELVNSYDNTILYDDFIMSRIIDILKKNSEKWNSTLLFMSDHGESLGEKGLYLHGMPYAVAPDEQTHIPMLSWMSQGFAQNRGIDMACVTKQLPQKSYSHDNLFHTLSGLLAVTNDAYNKDLDVFAPCKTSLPNQH